MIILSVLGAAAGPVPAQTRLGDLVQLSVLDGGQTADGRHLAALRLDLKEGWKTYWRSPGDAGIPPSFSWEGSRNLGSVEIVWPAPVVFDQGGLSSVGYVGQLVLPLRIGPVEAGAPVRLAGELDFGICKEVCIPARLSFAQELDPAAARNPAIAAAMAQRPFSAREAGVGAVTCDIRPSGEGMRVETRIAMPRLGGEEVVILEPGNPHLWASDMETRRSGEALVATGEVLHGEGHAFALDRSAIRFTVLGGGQAVEIHGCTPG